MSVTLDRIRAKYPQYKDISDEDLALRIGEKYPVYLDSDPEFKELHGIGKHNAGLREGLKREKQDLVQEGKASAMAIPLLSGMEAGTKLVSKMDPLEAIAQAPLTVGRALGLNEPEHWESPIKPEDIIGSEQSDDVTQGLKQAAAEFISGSTSLEGAAGLALGARYPQAIGRVFQTEAIRNLPAAIQRLREAETTKEKVAAGAGVAANVAIPGLLQHGLQPKPGPVPPPYRGTALEMPRGAAKPRVEWMEEAPGVEIDNPTVTPTFPNRSLERRPLVEEAIENLPNAKPLTEGAPDAIQPEGAQVLRTLQEKPVEGEGQVPVAGDVVEAGQPRSQAQLPPEETVKPAATTEEVLGAKPAEPPPADVVPAPEAPKTSTSIKNAVVDQERAARGLPPAMEVAKRDFETLWDEAMAKAEADPFAADRLIDDLNKKPRAVTDVEDAQLLHRQVELQNEHSKAAKELTDAIESGNSVAYADAKSRLSDVSDRLLKLYEVNKAVGTETGRGLNARKMLANEDFTLAKMEIDRRVTHGGRRLTPSEMTEIVRMQAIIDKTQKAFDAREQRIIDLEVAKLAAEASKGAKIDPGTQALVDRIIVGLDKEASAARNRIKARSEELRFSAGPLGELPNIKDYAIIGASHIVKGAVEFSRWSAKMIEEFGKGIEPHLKSIFEASNKHLDEKAASPTVAGKPVAKAVADKSAAALKAYKTRLKNQRAEYDRRITEKDFSQKIRKKVAMDPEAVRLKYSADKAKQAWMDLLFQEKMAQRTKLQKILGGAGEVADTSRAIITSLDLSAVLRQGGPIVIGHPIRAAKIFPDMIRAALSEEGQHAINMQIRARDNFHLYNQSKLYLSEHGHKLSKMEEVFMSRLIDKIPKKFGGGLIRGSQRAYTTFLNRLRADSFDAMAASLSKDGNLSAADANAISNSINVFTGRGSIPGGADAALAQMNRLFFAPRFVVSRFQLLGGQPFYRGSLASKKMIAKEYGRFIGGILVIYGLAKLAGADIEINLTSSDAGQIRFGKTRIDLLAGLKQVVNFITRFGGTKKTSSGKKVPIGIGENVWDFTRSKLAPIPGAAVTTTELATGKKPPKPYPQSMTGTKENLFLDGVIGGLTAPMQVRDILEAMVEQGIPRGTAMAMLSILGAGVRTYRDESIVKGIMGDEKEADSPGDVIGRSIEREPLQPK